MPKTKNPKLFSPLPQVKAKTIPTETLFWTGGKKPLLYQGHLLNGPPAWFRGISPKRNYPFKNNFYTLWTSFLDRGPSLGLKSTPNWEYQLNMLLS